MRNPIFLAAAVLLFAVPASATTPKISGMYIISYNEICQQNDPNNQFAGQGESNIETLMTNFDITTGMVKINATVVYAPLMGNYIAPATTMESETVAYSNTATTITVGMTAFGVLYGPVKKGIVQSMVFNGITNASCSASGTALRQ